MGLEDYSHVDILYVLDRVSPDDVEYGLRHPRNNLGWPKVGIFAQRAKRRLSVAIKRARHIALLPFVANN